MSRGMFWLTTSTVVVAQVLFLAYMYYLSSRYDRKSKSKSCSKPEKTVVLDTGGVSQPLVMYMTFVSALIPIAANTWKAIITDPRSNICKDAQKGLINHVICRHGFFAITDADDSALYLMPLQSTAVIPPVSFSNIENVVSGSDSTWPLLMIAYRVSLD